MKNVIAAAILAVAIVIASSRGVVHAQSTPVFPLIEMVQTTSQCVLHGGDSVACIGKDGVLYSYQGAAFVAPIPPPAVTGVTSFNGRTGAVIPVASDYPFPPAPVTSVNGKTGAVVLAATTTATTTVQ